MSARVLRRGAFRERADCMTETQTIYAAFLETFRSEVGFLKRMATEAYGSHPLRDSRGSLNLQKRVDMAQRPGVGLSFLACLLH